MITRIVKLEILAEYQAKFIETFLVYHNKIRGTEGCEEVKLVQSTEDKGVFFTISKWKNEAAIENYRKSELFGEIWPSVKPWFSAKAIAWSTVELN